MKTTNEQMKKTLVIGASTNTERYAYKAVVSLQKHGHEVIALGKSDGTINDTHIITTLEHFNNIDTVSLYINPSIQKEYYDYILALKPKRIIFNPGTENTAFEKLAAANGIAVEEACTLVLLSTNQF